MSITIKAKFNKQTKDSKKESMQFHVSGDDEHKRELDMMCREVVVLKIDGVENEIVAEFNKKTKDAKKTILEFIVKGDTSAAQTYEFYRMAGSTVDLTITESQMSIEEFQESHEGIEYKVNGDGTVEIDENQLSFDDIEGEEDELPFADVEEDEDDDLLNVTDINEQRLKRAAGSDDDLLGE